MDDLIFERINRAIAAKVFPGCAVGYFKKGGPKKVIAAGHFIYEPCSKPIKEDSIFDVASITKAIPGSSAILALLDQNKISLEDKLVDFVPEFGNFESKKEVTIKHLLTYTLDLNVPPMSSLRDKSADEIIRIIVSAPLKQPVGSRFLYTNSTAFFFGFIVQKITGKTLDNFSAEYFFKQLNMNRTTFHPELFDKEEIVPTEIDDWRGGLLQGVVHDESAFVLNKQYISGIAGLFSTAPDLLTFGEMLLSGGVKNGISFFSESIITQMHTNQLVSDIGAFAGLGWEMNDPLRMGKCAKEIIGKTGYTGCMVMLNFVRGATLVILSNRVYPKRPNDGGHAINGVRRDIADIIFGHM